MVEVFRTNVVDPVVAHDIVEVLHGSTMGYRANFDLGDCDRILRIACADVIDIDEVIRVVRSFGFEAFPLEDVPAFS